MYTVSNSPRLLFPNTSTEMVEFMSKKDHIWKFIGLFLCGQCWFLRQVESMRVEMLLSDSNSI